MVEVLESKPNPVKAVIYGLLVYIIVSLVGAIPVGLLYWALLNKMGVTTANFEQLSQSKLFFVSANVPGVVGSILGGYICAKYSQVKAYRNAVFMWIPILLVGVLLYTELWESLFILVTTLLGVMLGVYAYCRKNIVQLNRYEENPSVWKGIALATIAMLVFGMFGDYPEINFDIGTVVSIGGLIAIIGLSFECRLLLNRVWRIYFWVVITFTILLILVLLLSMATNNGVESSITVIGGAKPMVGYIVMVISAILYLIQLRGLYLYSYKRPKIWAHNQSVA